jgi:Flp pilus assembly protein TadB
MMDTSALDRQLSDLVYVLIKALRAGYSLQQSLEAVGESAPEPTAGALKGWLADLDAGCTYDKAFAHMQAAWPSPHLKQIADAIVRDQETGGNLAAQLEPLAERIYQAVGTDKAFYPEMRRQAEQLGGPLPERVRKG